MTSYFAPGYTLFFQLKHFASLTTCFLNNTKKGVYLLLKSVFQGTLKEQTDKICADRSDYTLPRFSAAQGVPFFQ